MEVKLAEALLLHRMGYTVPAGVTAEHIEHATRMLGL
jgi:hypothetical protein